MTTSSVETGRMLVDLQEALLTKQREVDELKMEIERLRLAAENDAKRLAWHDETLAERDAEIEQLRKKAGQRGARMQLMQGWLQGDPAGLWWAFCQDYPKAADWFDEDGVP